VEVALSAMERHSQNDLFFDPKKVKSVSNENLEECDAILDWIGIPFNSKTSMVDFVSIVSVK